MKDVLKNNKIRHILRMMIACLLTSFMYYFFYHGELGLMLFATVFVMLTTIGSAFFQGILRFFLLVGLVVIAYFLVPFGSNFYFNLNAVMLGSLVGIIVNTFILADRINIEFQRTVIPFLNASQVYFSAIVDYLIDKKTENIEQATMEIKNKLRSLPAWVYEPGFDLALQKGYRYYFMKLNHLAELLCAMHYLARYSYDNEWIQTIKNPLLQCVRRMDEFVAAIVTLLDLKKLKEGVIDFADDIAEIELLFKQMVPVPLELLETHQDYKYFAEFIYDLRELRSVLLQLAKALR